MPNYILERNFYDRFFNDNDYRFINDDEEDYYDTRLLYEKIDLIGQACADFAQWLDGVTASDFGDDEGLSGVLALI